MAAKKKPKKKLIGAERLTRNGITPGNPGNSGGKKGRSGRPPLAFKEFCAKLAADPKFQAALEEAASNSKHPSFIGASKLVASYAVGMPKQSVQQEITGRDGTPLIPLDAIRAAVAAADAVEAAHAPPNRMNGAAHTNGNGRHG